MRNQRFFGWELVWATVVLCLGVSLPGISQAQEVSRFIKVLDASGAPVTDLDPEDFLIEHDGVESSVDRLELTNEPLRVALLVDDAEGARGYFQHIRNGLPEFVNALPDDAEIAFILLSGRPRVIVNYDEGRDKLLEQMGSFFVDTDRGAGFFEGLTDTIERFDDDVRWPVLAVLTTDGPSQRRVTQGRYENYIDRLQERAATVHGLGLFTPLGEGFQTGIMTSVTQVTGGWYDTLNSPSQAVTTKLIEMATEIARRHAESYNQYEVVYELPPGTDPDAPISAGVRREGLSLQISMNGRPRPTIMQGAVATGGVSREELFNSGEAAFASGNTDEAADWYQQAHTVDPAWGKPLFKLALVSLNTGDIAAAVQYLEQVVEVDPNSEEGAQATALITQLKP